MTERALKTRVTGQFVERALGLMLGMQTRPLQGGRRFQRCWRFVSHQCCPGGSTDAAESAARVRERISGPRRSFEPAFRVATCATKWSFGFGPARIF